MGGLDSFELVHHLEVVREVREEVRSLRKTKACTTLRHVKSGLDKKESRRLDYSQERGTGTWLSATPNFACRTILSLVEFIDEIRG